MFRFGLLAQLLLRLRLEFEIWLLCWVKYTSYTKFWKLLGAFSRVVINDQSTVELNLRTGKFQRLWDFHRSYDLCTSRELIKSILIHEYQHESTRINTGWHDSTRVNTSPTRVNTGPTWVNTNQHESTRVNTSLTRVNTEQHECKTGLDHEKEKSMVKRKDKTWLNI